MKLVIPKFPDLLQFTIDKLWSGEVCNDERVKADVTLSLKKGGLFIRVEAPVLHNQSIPNDPMGSRVEKLWTFDVVEIFLVGPGHQYLEIEIGAGGHYLILGFDSVRNKSNDYLYFHPVIHFYKTNEKTWVSETEIPWSIIPENLRAMNAFMIAVGQFLALSPLPGEVPDFHQPDHFPPLFID